MTKVKFMPHQIEAIDRLRSGSILCAGVGTGKSITALGYYVKSCGGVMWNDRTMGPMLDPVPLYIITTARKRDTGEWDREYEKLSLEKETNIVVDSWNNLHKYENEEYAFFIFDEQRVVGSGRWVKSFIKISRGKGNRWMLLSATPGDNWMDYIPVFIANGFYRNRSEFLRRHAVYNRYSMYPKVDKWLESGHLEALRRCITVTMKFEKNTVPHWNELVVLYDEDKYKRVANDRWDIYENKPIQEISRACSLMRRVCNEDERRVAVVRSILNEHKKVIIFYNYDYELDLLKKGISGHGVAVAEWNGHRHEEIPDNDRWAYLVQYMAGAEGWNCIETDTILFYSQNYSYKLMTQAAGRIDRMNTPFRDLYYYVIETESPIDKAIARALKGKKNFNENNFLKW